jgi:hypothetical protein
MRKYLGILVFILASLPGFLFGQVNYVATPGTTQVAWDAVSYTIDHYEVTLVRDTGETYTYGTSNTQLVIPRPRSGRFTIKVRAVLADTTTSDYCLSTDSTCSVLSDGTTAGAWKVEFRPIAPIGPLRKN